MLFAVLDVLLSASVAQAAAPAPCTSPLHRQFDFWLGLWDVTGANGAFAGTNRIELADAGCTLYESWASGRGGYTGRSLNSVGPDGRWHQTWVDSSGGRLELAGGLVEGKMVLEGETPAAAAGGPPVRNRITWTPLPEARVRQLWETSSDGGKSYTIAFEGLYQPVKSAASSASLLTMLAGAWIGSGTVQAREAHVELRVEPVLGGRFARLVWSNLGGKDGRELFEGLAIYEQQPDGTLAASWWDSQGARHSVRATADAAALTALWGERGRTVYRLLSTGELEVTDSLKQADGGWREFGRTTLRRK
jgi:hypothetical protein